MGLSDISFPILWRLLPQWNIATINASITSKTIAEFTISSIQAGNWTNHCIGTVTKKKAVAMAPRFDEVNYRNQKLLELGTVVCKRLSNIRTNPALEETVADTELCPEGVSEHDSACIVHPAAMDTCIQVVLIVAHKVSLAGLKRSFVPTSMANVSLWFWGDDDQISQLTPGKGKVLAHAEIFSLRAMSGWCQLSSPEGKPLFEIEELSCNQYSEALDDLRTIDRHPYLRTVWKPDVDKMISNLTDNSLLDLIVHKRPGFNFCEILNTKPMISDNLHKVLESGSSLRRYQTYTVMTLGDVDIEPIKVKYEAFPGVVVQKLGLDDVPETFFDLFRSVAVKFYNKSIKLLISILLIERYFDK
ncbi:uncharacterized protein EAE98_012458 [Botrytis deweyae]|uniref:Polyketide synthase dehydratase domain-containing protein n=1 Tax=Botrytis deweyae TaxID=2478750 RepID=A0ABQ7I2X1_9HELO|nr:uncharacterized protein EAE98_012458 [Botrytis deweyae]KAF7908020.1 hypothetical protein EAE98_012458 [Botrytis deweyae]